MKTLNIKKIMKYFEKLTNTYIVNFAEIKNENFTNYEYFTIERKNYLFYIEKNTFSSWTLAPVTITAYKKIDFWHKIQCDFPKGVYSMSELLSYISKNIKRESKPLKNVHIQRNLDFEKYKAINETNYKNIFERLDLGYREKNILQNIERVEMEQNDGTYLVYKIIDKSENYFKIEKNSERIVG